MWTNGGRRLKRLAGAREIGCMHCRLDFNENCANDRRCMRDLLPEDVLAVIRKSVVWKGNLLQAIRG
jgi:hypothetical protein